MFNIQRTHLPENKITKKQSNYIKAVAAAAMLADHVGVILLSDIIILRIIGRIAFPLFAYQLGIGYLYTKNFKKHFARILLFAVAIQGIYAACTFFANIQYDPENFNIFFTLALGLAAIYCYDNKKYLCLLFIFILSSASRLCGINLDYGEYGVLLILVMYIQRNNIPSLTVSMLLLNVIYCVLSKNTIQLFSMLSLIFIAKPYSLKFPVPGLAFYLFYPAHLALLYIIKMLINIKH